MMWARATLSQPNALMSCDPVDGPAFVMQWRGEDYIDFFPGQGRACVQLGEEFQLGRSQTFSIVGIALDIQVEIATLALVVGARAKQPDCHVASERTPRGRKNGSMLVFGNSHVSIIADH